VWLVSSLSDVLLRLAFGMILHVEPSKVLGEMIFPGEAMCALSITSGPWTIDEGLLVLGSQMSGDISLTAEELVGSPVSSRAVCVRTR
jgi:hypothetical protein